uniref:Uncharacterized protein n=1 Tax=Anguilla anguilla TaxID=7936 RepID=A0A0E9WLD0_ANGAN
MEKKKKTLMLLFPLENRLLVLFCFKSFPKLPPGTLWKSCSLHGYLSTHATSTSLQLHLSFIHLLARYPYAVQVIRIFTPYPQSDLTRTNHVKNLRSQVQKQCPPGI